MLSFYLFTQGCFAAVVMLVLPALHIACEETISFVLCVNIIQESDYCLSLCCTVEVLIPKAKLFKSYLSSNNNGAESLLPLSSFMG